jgi:hypothetical protein
MARFRALQAPMVLDALRMDGALTLSFRKRLSERSREKSLVRSTHCVPVPDNLDDVTAAAIANPGMSALAALVERAHLQPGETVLVNGATGTAGRLAVLLAKHLGASKVIGTGRNEGELQEVLPLGADVVIPFTLSMSHPPGAKHYEQALLGEFGHGIDVVMDYLWGQSAKTIIVAIAKAVEDAGPVRFVPRRRSESRGKHRTFGCCPPFLRHQLMGSGVKSVPFPKLLDSIRNVFDAVLPATNFRSRPRPCLFQRLKRPGTRPENHASCSPFSRSPISALGPPQRTKSGSLLITRLASADSSSS